jgi:hypothetical protein
MLADGDRSITGLFPLWLSCTPIAPCCFQIADLGFRYLFSYLDRSALANASIFGFRTDLSLSSVQYNLISTVSHLSIPPYPLNSDDNALLHC